jgi:hypothetical protein
LNPRWQVSFKGLLTEDARDLLAQAGIVEVADKEHPTVWLRAADKPNAIKHIKNVLAPYGSFSDFEAAPVNYSMYLGFLESEATVLSAATEMNGDPRVSAIASTAGTGSAEIYLEIPADSRDDAVRQAKAVYADLRAQAGLPPAEPLYGFLGQSGHFPSEPISPPSPQRPDELADRSRQLFDEKTYDYAIVAAQTACEVTTFDAITKLLEDSSESAALRFTNRWLATNKRYSLNEDRLRELWNVFTGDEIQKEAWWRPYQEHVVRRHRIVHEGWTPSRREAEQSLKAADSFRAHIKANMQQALLSSS